MPVSDNGRSDPLTRDQWQAMFDYIREVIAFYDNDPDLILHAMWTEAVLSGRRKEFAKLCRWINSDA